MSTTADYAAQREALVERVRKLQKMTQENGCSEAEATFAAQRIAAIMAEHALTQDELSIKADALGCVKDEFIFFGHDYGDWMSLKSSIARLFACKSYADPEREEDILDLGFTTRIRPFVFFGFPQDVTASIATMSICFSAVATETERQYKGKYSRDFAQGMVMRLCERINDLQPKVKTGSALIVLKDQLVTDEWAKLGIKLRYRSYSRKVNAAAYAKGFAEGAHVNLSGGRNATTTSAAPRQLGAR